jgi:hypothetical protein
VFRSALSGMCARLHFEPVVPTGPGSHRRRLQNLLASGGSAMARTDLSHTRYSTKLNVGWRRQVFLIGRSRLGNGLQLAIVRGHSGACALSLMPGNS